MGQRPACAGSRFRQTCGWVQAAGAPVASSVTKEERVRQEAIFELVTTEQDYVNDLEIVKQVSGPRTMLAAPSP